MIPRLLFIAAMVLALRLPFLQQPIQGDDPYYLYAAEHAQIDPLHPNHARFLFQGDLVDMRGHPHPPLNSWVLAGLLAVFGDIREARFHLAYVAFSLIAALAMYSLARRFCEKPVGATLLFLAVPAFVVNGTSLEADLPFLAMWMVSMALFVHAVDRASSWALVGASVAGALAGLAAYQAVFLTPILAVYLWRKRQWKSGWIAVLAAPAALAAWQLWERATSGAAPGVMLAGYMQTYGLEALASKARNAAALVVHSGWIVSPLFVVAAGFSRWRAAIACAAALGAALFDANPLFWISIGCGVWTLCWAASQDFLGRWILIFFAGALIVFFAGSARYLLPIAAPVAILVARSASPWLLRAGFTLQMALSIALAVANYQHWDGYRRFAQSIAKDITARRTWVNAEWGLRYYLESEGALPIAKNPALTPGDIIVTSDLAFPVRVEGPVAPLSQAVIVPSVPLRLISLSGRSAYSSAARGLLPFEISWAPADRVRAEAVLARNATYSFLDPRDPRDTPQILSGLYPDGWMTGEATVVLKTPGKLAPLRVEVYIPPQAVARRVTLLAAGQIVAEDTFPQPGLYALAAPVSAPGTDLIVTVAVDRTFSAPGDARKLGVVIRGIGFR